MSGQQWRKALWHLRHGGVEGFKEFRRKRELANTSNSIPQAEHRKRDFEDHPMLSVIVPAFNASDFVERCLRSILHQHEVSLEIIVIDDGSTDDTVEKVSALSRNDKRVTVLTGQNEGPARARNRGVEAARGVYITFVDADDEVLPDAYSTMVNSLERTGSDIVTGSYIRIGTFGRSRPKLTARVHARQRLAVRLDDMPELLEEPVLWNKIYRRDFWRRHVGEMWGFSNYEDQEPAYRALVGAAAIDVLTNDVYAWRLAEGRDTRSKRKAELTDLQAKLEVIEALKHTIQNASDHVVDQAYAIWMGTDLAMHAEYLDTAHKRFRRTLCDAAKDLKQSMSKAAWKLLPAQERLYMWVVASGDLDDIEEVLGTRLEETRAVPLEHVDGSWTVAPTYLSRLKHAVPKRLLKAQPVDFKPVVVVRNAKWIGDHEIEFQGCAYIPGIDPGETTFRIQGVMDGATVLDVPAEERSDNRVDLDVDDPWRSYASGGFRACIDVAGVADISPRGINLFGTFTLERMHLQSPVISTTVVGMIAPSPLVDSGRLTVIADAHNELSIRPVEMPEQPIVAKNVGLQGRDVTVVVSNASEVRALTLSAGSQSVEMAPQGPSTFTAALPELPEQLRSHGERQWRLSANTDEGRIADVYHEAVDYLLPGTSCVRLAPNAEGKVRLEQRYRRVSITGATNDRDRLLIIGRIDPPETLNVVLKSSEQKIAPTESVFHADGSFTSVYDLTTTGVEGGKVAALSGGYHLRYGENEDQANSWARVADKLAIRPVDCFTEWSTLRVEGRDSGAVSVKVSPPWSPQERTKFGRFKLRKQDWGPVDTGIVFESYNGKSANDNPRALFDIINAIRNDIPLYWAVRDRRVDVPEGGKPVVEGTAEWHKALAASRILINNNNFPYFVQKPPEQFYLQTWHGTPIKRLLNDQRRRSVPLSYRRLMRKQVEQWDILLAESTEAEKRLRSGLGYSGKVELAAYPRNRRVTSHPKEVDEIKEKLGLDTQSVIILYAPTWRQQDKNSKQISSRHINLQILAESIDCTIISRMHHVAQKSNLKSASRVLDLSQWPHVEDLISISDLLITDYSSLSFDFKNCGKPVVYYSPDHMSYRADPGIYQTPELNELVEDEVELARLVEQTLQGNDNSPEWQLQLYKQEINESDIAERILAVHDYGKAFHSRTPANEKVTSQPQLNGDDCTVRNGK
ncbi:bifunctional glycosyltransferase/CDP-glycerol:glycerophosphate glycerophosphotransferase [Brevibacterium aurantiacum]|uniref:bifunctional glycosyltransferase/CDP-glycerol:glycerophosphate glycerophosphotransferase n=1 Tax=Brevibacterium aurantiacum TaxID=273384 RepID=UPI001866E573|nr:CDP-glycerol glycerophosphotransferase family protein [Brevibacterium aurantiacum]